MEHVVLLFLQLSLILATSVAKSARSLCSPGQGWHGSPARSILCQGKAHPRIDTWTTTADGSAVPPDKSSPSGLKPSRREAK